MNFFGGIVLLSTFVLLASAHQESTKNGLPEGGLFEGDMAGFEIDPIKGIANRPTSTLAKWPGGIVPYVIQPGQFGQSQLNTIYNGMRALEDQVRVNGRDCIKFVDRTDAHSNWLRIFSGSGCWSYVLMNTRPGAQDLSLQTGGCTIIGTVIHELLHALGFYHEQSRPDRDSYVRILSQNVQNGMLHNFDKYGQNSVDTMDFPYDVQSIMHYENKAFSKNGLNTIEALDNTPLFPAYSKTRMTQIDIDEVRKFYNCV